MNPTRMDEWRETNLEVLTFDYLQPPELNACCFWWWRLSRAQESVDIGCEEKKKKRRAAPLWSNRPEPENERAA